MERRTLKESGSIRSKSAQMFMEWFEGSRWSNSSTLETQIRSVGARGDTRGFVL